MLASPRPRSALYVFADPFAPAAVIAAQKAKGRRSAAEGADTARSAHEPASAARSPAVAMFDAASPDLMPAPPAVHGDAVEPLPAVSPALPSFGRFRLVDLPPRGCRWPTAEEAGSHLFCGVDRVAGRSYCPSHFKASRQPARAAHVLSDAERAKRAAIGRQNLTKRAA